MELFDLWYNDIQNGILKSISYFDDILKIIIWGNESEVKKKFITSSFNNHPDYNNCIYYTFVEEVAVEIKSRSMIRLYWKLDIVKYIKDSLIIPMTVSSSLEIS